MRLVLFQPDIPQNMGTLLRLGACMNVAVDVIDPCGFPWNDAKLRRAGMDYIDHVSLTRHVDFAAFDAYRKMEWPSGRLVLLTTKSATPYTQFLFHSDDLLMVGRESAGVPEEVAAACDVPLCIPMQPPMRSLNVAIAGSMALGEALRQTTLFPAIQER